MNPSAYVNRFIKLKSHIHLYTKAVGSSENDYDRYADQNDIVFVRSFLITEHNAITFEIINKELETFFIDTFTSSLFEQYIDNLFEIID